MDKQAISGWYDKCCDGEGTGCHENMGETPNSDSETRHSNPKLEPKGKVGVSQTNMG